MRSSDSASPDIRELLGVIEDLDADNERLRMKALELMELMECAVTQQVSAERRLAELDEQVKVLQSEIDALHSTKLMRFVRPLRSCTRARLPGGRFVNEQYPVFVPVRDRVTSLRLLVDWLERAGQEDIWLVDNASTYEPLVEYLRNTPHHVVRSDHNLGHRSPWLTGTVQRHAHGCHFVVTDPDVVPDERCPLDAIDHFRGLLERHPHYDKVGFGLRIDDLPVTYPLAAAVRAWEARFWTDELEPGVYRADIDTTFALYRPLDRRHDEGRSLRTGAPYVARHVPWYLDTTALTDEEQYYREHADPTISNWDRDRLPRWKERWLAVQPGSDDDDRT